MPYSLDGVKIILTRQTREYEEYRTDMLELASTLTPEWTDFYPHDVGVVLVETQSGLADNLSYYIDRGVHESYWGPAQRRIAYINMGKLIGYTFDPASSATVDMTVVVSAAGLIPGIDTVSEVPFSVGNQATIDNRQFTFELIEEFDAPAAGTYTLTFIEGKTIFREVLGSSSGLAGQRYSLGKTGITLNVDGTVALRIEVFNGIAWETWTLVENFIDSSDTDQHYTFSIDEVDNITITFGDGINGAVPTVGVSNIRATYRIGGGSEANLVGIGKITKKLTTAANVTSVTNAAKPSGGADKTSIEEARVEGPKQYKTQDRAVTHADYEAEAKKINGVFKARAGHYNNVLTHEAVYIAATGDNPVPTGTWNVGKQSGTGTLGAVGRALNAKKASSVVLHILPMTALDVAVEIDIYVKSNFYRNDVKSRSQEVVEAFIRGTNIQESRSLIPLSGLNEILEAVNGVDYVNVKQFHRKPYIEQKSIGIANSTFSSVSTGVGLLEETWIVFMQSATTFKVIGSKSGTQVNTGTLGTSYSTDNGELTFTITAGDKPNKTGDLYKIMTSAYIGNVYIQTHEVPILTEQTLNMFGGIR